MTGGDRVPGPYRLEPVGPEPTDEEIREFDRMAWKAADLHTLVWCLKDTWYRFTVSLRARECLRCHFYVGRGGECDPL